VDVFLYLDLMVVIFLEHIKDMFYYLVHVFFIGNIKNSSCNSNDDANILCRMIVRVIIEIFISMCLLSIKLMGHRDIIFLRSQDIHKKVFDHFLLFPY
jgi:ABC-type multidrug transport system fused ATPase/permease subunit